MTLEETLFPKKLGSDAPRLVVEYKPNAEDPIRVLLQKAGPQFEGLLQKVDEPKPWGVALNNGRGKILSFVGESLDEAVRNALNWLEEQT